MGSVIVVAMVGAVATTIAGVALNVATGGSSPWLPMVQTHPVGWTVGGAASVAIVGVVGRWVRQRVDRGLVRLVPAERRPAAWVVDRPVEVGLVVSALCRPPRGRAAVGITTAVRGAGGFGKTTVAMLVAADRRVLHRFGGGIYWVTLGRDVRGDASIADKVNDLISQVDPDRAVTFTDPAQAGQYLSALLRTGPRRLIVLDDVWYTEQESAFPVAGRCMRLVTTRIPTLVAGTCVAVEVDEVSPEQAQALVTTGLPALPKQAIAALLAETGRWPLLLRLVNKLLADQLAVDLNASAAASVVVQRLRRSGVLQVDELTGAAADQLNVNDPRQRQRAVATTIEASLGLLAARHRARFVELAVFVEDEAVPIDLIHQLWRATAGFDLMTTRALCVRLHDLALATLTATDHGGVLGLHDVIRDYLAQELDHGRMAELHGILVDSVAADLPSNPDPDGAGTAWWELGESSRYLWDHLVEHLLGGGRRAEAEAVASDLRWVAARLEQSGPIAPFADLAQVDTARTADLQMVLGQAAHLLTPTDPGHSALDILYSRVGHHQHWAAQSVALASARSSSGLSNHWPLPDLPHPALRQIYHNHSRGKCSLLVSPDGSWLACASDDGAVRVWDMATSAHRVVPRGDHSQSIAMMAVAPDGSWLACGDDTSRLLIWDVATWSPLAEPGGHGIKTLAAAPNGSWLAFATVDGVVRIWDVPSAAEQALLDSGRVTALAVSSDGSWLATGGFDGAVRIWEVASWTERTTPLDAMTDGNEGPVTRLVVAPDGSWLASSSRDELVRVWDMTTRRRRAELATKGSGPNQKPTDLTAVVPDGSGLVYATDERLRFWDASGRGSKPRNFFPSNAQRALAIAPDSSWLVSADSSSASLRDMRTGKFVAFLGGHNGTSIDGVAVAPDGSWLATAGYDGTIRIWDVKVAIAQGRRSLTRSLTPAYGPTGHEYAVDVASDGSWLASGSYDNTVRIWNTATAECQMELEGHTGFVRAVSVSPDGSWVASGGKDRTVRVWDVSAGTERAVLIGHTGDVRALAVAPDGSWLASGGTDGQIRLWDVADAVPRGVLTGHRGSVRALAACPDGKWLASGGADGVVRIWDVVAGTQISALVCSGPILTVSVAAGGDWLAAGGYGKITIWDTHRWTTRTVLDAHAGSVTAMAAAPEGDLLASVGRDRTVRIWAVRHGRCETMMRVDQDLTACSWSPGGPSIAVAGERGRPYLFDLRMSRRR